MKGPIRQMVDQLKVWADAGGLTIEQTADLFDRVNRVNTSSSTDAAPDSFVSMTPAKGKH